MVHVPRMSFQEYDASDVENVWLLAVLGTFQLIKEAESFLTLQYELSASYADSYAFAFATFLV